MQSLYEIVKMKNEETRRKIEKDKGNGTKTGKTEKAEPCERIQNQQKLELLNYLDIRVDSTVQKGNFSVLRLWLLRLRLVSKVILHQLEQLRRRHRL